MKPDTDKMKCVVIERLRASIYYGHRSPGQVVLVNGHIVFHGKECDARKFEARIANGNN